MIVDEYGYLRREREGAGPAVPFAELQYPRANQHPDDSCRGNIEQRIQHSAYVLRDEQVEHHREDVQRAKSKGHNLDSQGYAPQLFNQVQDPTFFVLHSCS